ncbi:uncharacterized protein LOC130088380 [Rhinichthys klamathensis goyatoka]|uniref:uncharacterized protein LOC130088380 n=1 Tax=Rhinichthys klamathensis goyatoka TaxID=3034132 RepID=UPI0024B57AAA|nr:uncharacterized protein LOC130088380 [Rhinichthys klamathensis goyatoka]
MILCERIAVEYLLAQSDKGDLLNPQQHSELGIILPDLQVEVQEEQCLDLSISDAADILIQRPPEATQCDDQLDIAPPQNPLPPDDSPNTSSQDTGFDVSGVSCSPVSPASSLPAEDNSSSRPSTSVQESRCDSRGFPGWEAVDNLAEYLVNLNRTIAALSATETAEIVRLYSRLHEMDKSPSKYSLKSKKKTLPGPWRASRKRSGSAPGQQAAERLFMTHGQGAQRPDFNRTSECVSLRLLKEFAQARNRPRDCKGKTLPIPQSIVQAYHHIKQLLEDSRVIQEQTNLVLVTINNTTVSSWLHDRQKRTDRDSLLQGVQLPQKVSVAKDPLPQARALPSAPVEHGHAKIQFQEPENHEGEAVIRPRHSFRSGSALAQHYPLGPYVWPASSALLSSDQQEHTSPAPSPAWPSYQQGHLPPVQPPAWSSHQQEHTSPAPLPACSSYQLGHTSPAQPPVWPTYQQGHPPPAQPPVWPTYQQGHPPPAQPPVWPTYQQGHPPPAQPPVWPTYQQGHPPPAQPPGWYQQGHPPPATSPAFSSQSPLSSTPSDQSLVIFNRHRQWRQQKAALEDEKRLARGEPPKKRQTKEHYHYVCKTCGQSKSKQTGHSQVKGKWYCPASGQTIAEWKDSL